MSTKTTVTLTPSYRLVADSMQYIVQRKYAVDPTLAPGWEKRVADAEANGDPAPDATIREEWRDDGYFGLHSRGFTSALDFVAIRESQEHGGELTLREYAQLIRESHAKMSAAVEHMATA